MFKGRQVETNYEAEAILHEAVKITTNALGEFLSKDYVEQLKVHIFAPTVESLVLGKNKQIGFTYKTIGSAAWAFRQMKNFKDSLLPVIKVDLIRISFQFRTGRWRC